MLDILQQADRELFLVVNSCGTRLPLLDGLMLFISGKWSAIPLYALLAFVLWRVFGGRNMLWILVASVTLIILTDQGSVVLFKEQFQRLRPCHDPLLDGLVRLVAPSCGGRFGFVSSHASNTFGLAAFCAMLLWKQSPSILLLFVWASAVGLSRIWLGVHLPGDVIVGAAFGLTIGAAMGFGLKQIVNPR